MSHHQYQKVPLDPESDSEDDQTVLYAASALNEGTGEGGAELKYGVYGDGPDLTIPPTTQVLPGKDPSIRRNSDLKVWLLLICVITTVLMLFLVAVVGFVLLKHNFTSPHSVPATLPSFCTPIPKPLANAEMKPCLQTVGQSSRTSAGQNLLSSVSHHYPFSPPSSPSLSPSPSISSPSPSSLSHTSPSSLSHTSPSPSSSIISPSPSPSTLPSSHLSPTPPHPLLLPASSPTSPSPSPSPSPSCFPVPKPLPNMEIHQCHLSITTTNISAPTSTRSSAVSTTAITVTEDTSTVIDKVAEISPNSNMKQSVNRVVSLNTSAPNHPHNPAAVPLSWERRFSCAYTESSPQLRDLNRDGVDDVVMVVEDSAAPCGVKVLALNGQDGETVWEHLVEFSAFALRCILDLNEDGVVDCIVSGRVAGFVALSGVDGSLLWTVDPSIVFPPYNFYYPLPVGDLDGDGVEDLINVHGGDSHYKPEDHDRSPGFVVAVSGQTGHKLMEPIPMPDGHESYISPVMFTLNGTSQFVLFGSGGETVPGSLWAIEFSSIRSRVSLFLTSTYYTVYNVNSEIPKTCSLDPSVFDTMRPVFDETEFDLTGTMPVGHMGCPMLADKHALWNRYDVCLYKIVHSDLKGALLPPVIVDLTADGVDDLVASMYDGRTLVLDGRDMSTVVWEANYPGTESYSLPTPLFYTSDDIPDLVIQTNVGAWPSYNISTIRVLNGSDGSELWKFDSAHSGMMSAVSVVSKTHGQDALVFLAVGDANARSHPARKMAVDMAKEAGRSFLNESSYDDINLWVSTPDDPVPDPSDLDAMLEYCGYSKAELSASVYMVTREMIESGMDVRPLASYEPFVLNNNVTTLQDPTHQTHENNDDNTDSANLGKEMLKQLRCQHINSPTAFLATPLIGDFNSDGHMDITYSIVWAPSQGKPQLLAVVASTLEGLFEKGYGKEILDFEEFLPVNIQPWTQYMGKNGDNVFHQF